MAGRSKLEPSPFKGVAVAAARAADDKKAEDIVLWNIRAVSGVADFLLLASVTSPAHLEAVEIAVTDLLESAGVELRHRDGPHSDLWRVLDYGGLLVHLMHPEARSFYALDKLYREAPKTRWLSLAPPRGASSGGRPLPPPPRGGGSERGGG